MNIFSRTAIFLLSSLVLSISPLYADNQQNLSFEDVLSLGLPVVEINTVDKEEPTADPIECPEGCMGAGITNATKVPGSVVVYSPDGSVIYESGDYVKKESGITVKIRGNTSTYSPKKPYKIKLQKKGDMLGRGDKKFNDKNWVLIRSYNLKTYFGNKVGEITGHPWMPAGMFVNVIFNGDYRGLYYLQESVERNEKCRIEVEDDGFVMEHDPYWWNENGEYLEAAEHPRYSYTFKYPEYEDATEEQLQSIHETLKKYEASITDGSYPEVIDVESFANWILGHDILGTSDGGGVNWYLTKNSLSDDSPIKCGPLWDFDSSEINTDCYSQVHIGRFRKFFQNSNNLFSRVYIKRWNEKKHEFQNALDSIIEDLNNPEWAAYDASVLQDRNRWTTREATTEEVYERVKAFYTKRFEWLDQNIRDMEVSIMKQEAIGMGLPFIAVTTEDNEMPTGDFITSPDNLPGVAVETHPIRIKSLECYSSEGVLTDCLTEGDNFLTVHPDAIPEDDFLPLRFTIQRKTENLNSESSEVENEIEEDITENVADDESNGEPEDDTTSFNEETWELLSNHDLKSLLNIEAAAYLFEEIPTAGDFVNLYINGKHYGLYMRQESQPMPHVNVADGGFILKNDHRWWNYEENYLPSMSGYHHYTFVTPSIDELSPLSLRNLLLTLNDWEESLENPTDETTDMESFARWMLLQDITGTGHETDRYIYATDSQSPVKCLPHINAFTSENSDDCWSTSHELLWNDNITRIFNGKADLGSEPEKKFAQCYIDVWDAYGVSVFDKIRQVIEHFKENLSESYDNSIKSAYSRILSDDASDDDLDPHLSSTVSGRATKWYTDRQEWMTTMINRLQDLLTHVESVGNENTFRVEGNLLIGCKDIPTLTVSGIDGCIYVSRSLPEGESIMLPGGCWIVSDGNKSYKVIL